jgi:predicted O-methyltransferase YrrM
LPIACSSNSKILTPNDDSVPNIFNEMTYMNYLILGLLLSGLVIQILVLYKVRKIHLASYRLVVAADRTESETHTLYQQLQAYDGLMRLIRPTSPLPPLRHWAASPDFLLELARHVRHQRPTAILECSSGSSTLVLARCCELNGAGHVYSLEHEESFALETRQRLAEQGLNDWATVIHAPLVRASGSQQPWYDLNQLPGKLAPVDMLVIDGPPASTAKHARYPALPRLDSLLAAGASVFLDDAGRTDEQEILRRWSSEYPAYLQTKLYLEKGGVLLKKSSAPKA